MKLSERMRNTEANNIPQVVPVQAVMQYADKVEQLEAELGECRKLAKSYIDAYEKFAIENGLHELEADNERLKKRADLHRNDVNDLVEWLGREWPDAYEAFKMQVIIPDALKEGEK